MLSWLAKEMEQNIISPVEPGVLISQDKSVEYASRSSSDISVIFKDAHLESDKSFHTRFTHFYLLWLNQLRSVISSICARVAYILDGDYPFRFDIELAALAMLCACAARMTALSLMLYLLWGSFYIFGSGLSIRFWRITQLFVFCISLFECSAVLGIPPSRAFFFRIPTLDYDEKVWLGLAIDYLPTISFMYAAFWLLSMCEFHEPAPTLPISPLQSEQEEICSHHQIELDIPTIQDSKARSSWTILPLVPYMLVAGVFIAASLYADIMHLILLLISIALFTTGPSNQLLWKLFRTCIFLMFLVLLVYQCPIPSWDRFIFGETADSNIGFRHFPDVGSALSSSGFLSLLIGFVILDIKRRLDNPITAAIIQKEHRNWEAWGNIRLAAATKVWNHNRIAEFLSMRRVQEEIRHHLRCLLSDTKRLGLENLEDTEVWPSVPSGRTVHFTIDRDRKIVEWNADVSLLTQWNAKDAMGLRAWDIFPQQYSFDIKLMVKKCLRSKSFRESQNFDTQRFTFVKKESRLQIDIDVWLAPLTEGDGSLCGIVFFLSPIADGSIYDAALGTSSQSQVASNGRDHTDLVDGRLNTSAATIRLPLNSDLIEAYSTAFVELIDAQNDEESIIGSPLCRQFVNDHECARVKRTMQDIVTSGGFIQKNSLLASMQSWQTMLNNASADDEVAAPAPSIFLAEVDITPVQNVDEELVGLDLSFKRHLVGDLKPSPFTSMMLWINNQITTLVDHVIFLDQDTFSVESTPNSSGPPDTTSSKEGHQMGFQPLLFRFIVSHTQSLCVFAVLLNLLARGSLATIIVPLCLFLYGLFVQPRVPPLFWTGAIFYTELIIALKLLVNIFSQPFELADSSLFPDIQENQSLGWAQFSGIVNTAGSSMPAFLCLDFICVFIAAIHLHILRRKGIDHHYNECSAAWSDPIALTSPITGDKSEGVTSQSRSPAGPVLERANYDLISPPSVSFSSFRRTSSESLSKDSHTELDEDKPLGAVCTIWKMLPPQISYFLVKLFALTPSGATDITLKPGRSYYIPSFIMEMITAVYIIFGWNLLTAASSSSRDQIRSQTFEGAMVGVLFLQILFIVWDRLNFLYRSVLMKVILQYVQVVFFFYLLFYSWPRNRQFGFSSNGALIMFCILKSIYWWLSCLQIRSGYPTYTLHHRVLFNKASKTRLFIYTVYRAIPFVAELEILLDWVSIDTSLDLFETFKLEDIYSNLYIVKGRLIYKREHRRGAPFPTLTKFTNGTLLFIGLMVVICIPLLLFSTASPVTSELNNVERGSMSLFLAPLGANHSTAVSFTLLESSSLTIEPAPPDMINEVGNIADPEAVQNIIAKGYSDAPWQLSPPSLASFIQTLNDTSAAIKFNMRFSFVHSDGTISDVTIPKESAMSDKDKAAMIALLLKTSTDPVLITGNFIPLALKLSSKSVIPIESKSGESSPLLLQLRYSPNQMWWELRKTDGHGMNILTFSDTITSGLLAAVIAMSITTIYVTIVLAVGRFLRSMVQNQVHSIIYSDLHDVTDLMLMCEGIFIARKQKEFELEEGLYRSLIRLYRSPDSLIQSTKRREKLKLD